MMSESVPIERRHLSSEKAIKYKYCIQRTSNTKLDCEYINRNARELIIPSPKFDSDGKCYINRYNVSMQLSVCRKHT